MQTDLVLFKKSLNSRCESSNCSILLFHHLGKDHLDIADLHAVIFEVVHGVMVLLTGVEKRLQQHTRVAT